MLSIYLIVWWAFILWVIVRGRAVLRYTRNILDNPKLTVAERLAHLDELPSFDKMYWSVWVWPISRFDPRSK